MHIFTLFLLRMMHRENYHLLEDYLSDLLLCEKRLMRYRDFGILWNDKNHYNEVTSKLRIVGKMRIKLVEAIRQTDRLKPKKINDLKFETLTILYLMKAAINTCERWEAAKSSGRFI